MGKSSRNGSLSMAILSNQRVSLSGLSVESYCEMMTTSFEPSESFWLPYSAQVDGATSGSHSGLYDVGSSH